METLQLKLFLSVAQTLSFTKTAQEYFTSQPTVSNQVRALETELGTKLLERDSHRVSLTQAGREFVPFATEMLEIQLSAENRLRNITEGRRGYVHIGMLSSSAELFSACLTEYASVQPNVQVDVDILEGAEMIRALSQNKYDIFFANSYMLPNSKRIEHKIVSTDQLHLFVHRDIADSIDMDDWSTLKSRRFVSVPGTDFTLAGQVRGICASRGIVPDIINYYNRADTLILAVDSGIGMAILPPRLRYCFNFPNVVSLPIRGDDAVIESVVAWDKKSANPDAKRFVALETLAVF